MNDMSKEMCPMGGKHEFSYLSNIYGIVCKSVAEGNYVTQRIY